MNQFIPLSVPNLHGNELAYTSEAIFSEWVSTGGAYITRFEQALAAYVGAPYATACQSGTAGLHLALLVCGVTSDHEVIVPTLTFVAAVNPVRYVGATPVFMDCDDSLCMDMDKLRDFFETLCTFDGKVLRNNRTGKQIKAVVVVHVFGNISDMEVLMDLSFRYHFAVIEDSTEALGSYFTSGRYAGKHAGTIGDVGVYSFNGNKIITTGGGGMVVSNNEALLNHARHLSTQAKTDEVYFVHDEIGYNYRMTNIQATLGLAQMEQLETFIETKAENYHAYQAANVSLLPFRNDIRPNRWFYSYMTEKRDELITFMKQNNVQTRPVWHLIHELEHYRRFESYRIERARFYWEHIVNLPCSTNLSQEDVGRVADLIVAFEG